MADIKINKNPGKEKLEKLGVRKWEIWTRAISKFPWIYDASETCYFLEGEVIVTPDKQKPIHLGKGDLVCFPKGLSCIWDIRQPVRRHYRFS